MTCILKICYNSDILIVREKCNFKMINFDEMEKILIMADVEKICKAIEGHGFRHANPDGIWEFKLDKKEIDDIDTITYEDIFDDKLYTAEIFKKVEKYRGYNFIIFTAFKIKRESNNFSMPFRVYLYTDAPINEEYVKFQNEVIRCDKCHKKYVRKTLLDFYDEYLCVDCMINRFEKETRHMKFPGI